MKRLMLAFLFIAALLVAPSAFACWDCQTEIGYGGVANDRCDALNPYAAAKTCTETTRLTNCPDPNTVGPCYEIVCHLHEFCDIALNRPLMFGRRPSVGVAVVNMMTREEWERFRQL